MRSRNKRSRIEEHFRCWEEWKGIEIVWRIREDWQALWRLLKIQEKAQKRQLKSKTTIDLKLNKSQNLNPDLNLNKNNNN